MTPHDLVTGSRARRAVLYQYANAHERWSELEQAEAMRDHVHLEESAHQVALMLLRAYRAEQDDPQPEGTWQPS